MFVPLSDAPYADASFTSLVDEDLPEGSLQEMSSTQTMRRTALLLVAMVLALVVSSGVALAVTKSCVTGVDCFGTRKADTLNGTEGTDYMHGTGAGTPSMASVTPTSCTVRAERTSSSAAWV